MRNNPNELHSTAVIKCHPCKNILLYILILAFSPGVLLHQQCHKKRNKWWYTEHNYNGGQSVGTIPMILAKLVEYCAKWVEFRPSGGTELLRGRRGRKDEHEADQKIIT